MPMVNFILAEKEREKEKSKSVEFEHVNRFSGPITDFNRRLQQKLHCMLTNIYDIDMKNLNSNPRIISFH